MAGKPSRKSLVAALLAAYGRTFAEDLRIRVADNTPAPLFQLLCMSLLLSARIPAANAMRASRALFDAGLTTAGKMADASWQDRVDVLTTHGYKRYDESTATMLGDTAQRALNVYRGDLRRLRDEAERNPGREKALLQKFSGIGNVGSDIFLREVQVAWEEVYPYADARVLKAAQELGLAENARELAKLASRRDFARLAAALVHADLDKAYDELRRRA
jgi:hypothetical protein